MLTALVVLATIGVIREDEQEQDLHVINENIRERAGESRAILLEMNENIQAACMAIRGLQGSDHDE